MANSLLTPQIVANEALRILSSHFVLPTLVNRNYEKEFQRVGDTVNVRQRSNLAGKSFQGQIAIQDLDENVVSVKLDRIADVSVAITSKDMTLALKDFSQQVIEPAMVAISEKVESDLGAAIIANASETIAYTPQAQDLKDIAGLGKALDIKKAPMEDRALVFCVNHKYNYALADNLSKVSYAGDSDTLREARLGKIYGFNTFMTQALPRSVASQKGTATALKVSGTKGETKVSLSNVEPASGTFKNGEGFIVDNRFYRFTGDATANSGAVSTINIDEPLHKTFVAEKALLIDGESSIAFQKDAIAFVNRPLDTPEGAVKSYTANANGLSVRVTFDYDISTKEDIISFDILYGIGVLNNKLIAKLA